MKTKLKQNAIINKASVNLVKNKITILVILFLDLEKYPSGKLPHRKTFSQKKSPKENLTPENSSRPKFCSFSFPYFLTCFCSSFM